VVVCVLPPALCQRASLDIHHSKTELSVSTVGAGGPSIPLMCSHPPSLRRHQISHVTFILLLNTSSTPSRLCAPSSTFFHSLLCSSLSRFPRTFITCGSHDDENQYNNTCSLHVTLTRFAGGSRHVCHQTYSSHIVYIARSNENNRLSPISHDALAESFGSVSAPSMRCRQRQWPSRHCTLLTLFSLTATHAP
jgi:hypothetical protein